MSSSKPGIPVSKASSSAEWQKIVLQDAAAASDHSMVHPSNVTRECTSLRENGNSEAVLKVTERFAAPQQTVLVYILSKNVATVFFTRRLCPTL